MNFNLKKFPQEYLDLPQASNPEYFFVSRQGDQKAFRINLSRLAASLGVISTGGGPILNDGVNLPVVNNNGDPLERGDWTIMPPGTYGSITVPANHIGLLFYDGTVWSLGSTVDLGIDLSGYALKLDLDNLRSEFYDITFPSQENLFDPLDFQEGFRYNVADGVLTPDPLFACVLIPVEPGTFYTVYGNGPYLTYVRFSAGQIYKNGGVGSANPDGSFTLAAQTSPPPPTEFLGITLMNDGVFDRKNFIVIQQGSSVDLSRQVKFEKIENYEDILLKSYLMNPGTNMINKEEIVFGAQVGSSGPVPSDQMYIEFTPPPPPGTYCVSGIVNLSVRSRIGTNYPSVTRNIVDNYFTFDCPAGIESLYLNLAATSSDWWRADTVMMNPGSVPLPYSGFNPTIKPEFLPDQDVTGSKIKVVGEQSVPESPEEGDMIFNRDRGLGLVFDEEWKPLAGPRDEGKIYEWLFNGGSLAADNVSKSPGLVLNSENYSGTGYSIDAPAQTNLFEYIRFDDLGIKLLEFQKEILEIEITRVGSGANARFGILYLGETVSRKVHSMAGISATGLYLSDCVNNPPTSYSGNTVQSMSVTTGKKFRVEHTFFGRGRVARFWDISNPEEVFLGTLNILWPMTGSGGYANRPNNRSFGLMINNMGVKVTRYELFKLEPPRADLILMGDSISVSRVATQYEYGWAKRATSYWGQGAYLHGGGSNTAEDLLNSLSDTLAMKPKKVVLAIGTNDCNLDKPNRYAEHQSLVSQLEAVGAEVIISNVIPCGPGTGFQRVLDYNDWLQTTYSGTNQIVDQFSILANGTGDAWNPAYQADDLHPNDEGHRLMFENLKSYL